MPEEGLRSGDLHQGQHEAGLHSGHLSSGRAEVKRREQEEKQSDVGEGSKALLDALFASSERDRTEHQPQHPSRDFVDARIISFFSNFHITGPGVSGQGLAWSVHPETPKPASQPNDSTTAATSEAFFGTNASVGATLKVGISAGNINGNVIAAQLITVTVSGEYFVKITSDASFVETAWEVLNAASTPASSTYIGYNRLGTYTVAASVLTVTPDVGRPGRFGMVGYKNATGNEHVWWGDAAP